MAQEFAEAPEGAEEDGGPQEMDVDILPEGQGPEPRQEGGQQQQRQQDKPRMTTRYLTKYERARVLGTRALQIRCAAVYACSSPAVHRH